MLFRNMLDEQIALVERGEVPTVAVVDEADRDRMIDFPAATNPVGGLGKIAAADPA